MHEITLRSDLGEMACTLPEGWGDCAPGTWARLLPLWANGGPYSRAVLQVLLRTTSGRALPGKWWEALPSEALGPLFECLSWMPQPSVTPVQPSFSLGGRAYYFPAERMQNVTLAEFAFIDLAWQLRAYQVQRGRRQAAEEWTARLCAYLLRPHDPRINPTDADSYQGEDALWFDNFGGRNQRFSGGEHAWNILSESSQSITQGMYMVAVRDLDTDEVQTTTFTVVK